MKIEDVKVGMRVKLIDKTQGTRYLDSSVVYKRMLENKQDYAYVVRIDYYKNIESSTIVVSDKLDVESGDFFSCSDLVLDIKYERKQKLKELCSNMEIK